MALLHAKHKEKNKPSAALSVTANRVAKVRKLCASGAADIAADNTRRLAEDVREYIETGPPNPMHAADLWGLVQSARRHVEAAQ